MIAFSFGMLFACVLAAVIDGAIAMVGPKRSVRRHMVRCRRCGEGNYIEIEDGS